MRYSDDHKQTVRARIVATASHLLRKDGLSGVSIPAIMKKVGLTHGGFYAHFRDRDQLVAEAISFAAAQTAESVLGEGPGGITATLDRYLSRQHVDHPGDGCVLAALGTDAGRQPAPVRTAFAHTARGFLLLVERRLHPRATPGQLGDEALAVASRMIGAVVLARLVRDPVLADRILDAARATRPAAQAR